MLKSKTWITKAYSLIQLFLHSRWKFCFPQSSDILIYDAESSRSFFGSFLADYRCEEIFLRGEETNFWCLLSAIRFRSFWTADPIRIYAEQFIKFQKPKVVITTTDNRIDFYLLKKSFPKIVFIAIQNGSRDLADEFLLRIAVTPNLQCDYFFSFGTGIADVYKKCISCDVIVHGSLRNNLVNKLASDHIEDNVTFISEWERCVGDGEQFVSYSNDVHVSWSDFYIHDDELLRICVNWCRDNSKNLIIAGRQRDALLSKLEFQYFSERIVGCTWSFKTPTDFCSSYKVVDSARIVVGVGSTLLVEALARGNRVGIFNSRKFQNFNHRPFDYLSPETIKGKFWTDSTDNDEFLRIIKYLDSISDRDWELERLKYADRVMSFDQGNSQLIEVLNHVLLRSPQS